MSLGVDISNVNGHVDVAAIKRAHPNLAVLGIKRDEGTTFRDALAAENFAQAGKLGLVAQFYHFGRPERSPGAAGGAREAEFFLSDIAPYLNKPHMGAPVLDYETVRDVNYARAFVTTVGHRLGVLPVIYASASRVIELAGDPTCRRCRIWVADFGVSDFPRVPGMHYCAWQYTDKLDGRNLDASHILVDPVNLLLKKPPTYLFVIEDGKVVRKYKYGTGRVAAFLKGTWIRRVLKAGHNIRLRRGR